jgi:hypothetical protein
MVVTKVNMNIIENRFDGAIVEIKLEVVEWLFLIIMG